ncbi:hypothetical protein BH24ACI1_BH24ACI1_27830 [soil metagenome]
MLKKIIYASLVVLAGFSSLVFAQEKTVVNDADAKKMLLGKHLLSLQWISWDYFGTATITNKVGVLHLKGEQKQQGGSDFVKIDGTITSVDKKEFKFDGTIIMQISHINGGEPCTRSGEMTFAVTGKPKYWRLQEMTNPCDEATDYVDIYFRK